MTRRAASIVALATITLTSLSACSTSHGSSSPSVPQNVTPSASRSTRPVSSDAKSAPHPLTKTTRDDGSVLETFSVRGRASGLTGSVLVLLPKGYNPAKKYPVVEMLHGFPGHPESILPSTHVDRALDEQIGLGKIAPPIVVMPQENMPPSRDTECVDAPGQASGTWLGTDIPAFVRNTFPTKPNRDAWATWGFSAGGWCAAVVASQHSQTFSAAVSLVGYFKPDFEPDYVPFGPNSAQYRAADLVAMMQRDPQPIAYYVLAAEQDAVSYPTSKQFVAAVRKPATVQAHLFPRGGHSGSVWVPYLGDSLAFIGRLSGFQPT